MMLALDNAQKGLHRDDTPRPVPRPQNVPAILVRKDTFIVPADSSITVVSELANPGDWMYHCHILEHEEGGMMGIFRVQP